MKVGGNCELFQMLVSVTRTVHQIFLLLGKWDSIFAVLGATYGHVICFG